MAKQHPGSTITGTIGGIIYYKMGDHYYARMKTSHSRNKQLHSSNFANTRKQMADFGTISKANKLLRDSLTEHIAGFRSSHLVAKLTRQLKTVLDHDEFNEVGERKLMDGDARLLKGFDFNEEAPACRMIKPKVNAVIDRRTGKAAVKIAAAPSQQFTEATESTTHCSLHLVALVANLDTGKAEIRETATGKFSPDKAVAAMELEVELPAPGNRVVLLVLVLKFFSIAPNGFETRVARASRDMVTIVDVSTIDDRS